MAVLSVYYINMRTTLTENLLQKLERLVKKVGMVDIDFNNRYTMIKIYLGGPGNLAYLRVNYSKVLADLTQSQSGKVSLTNCNTLYVGRRKNIPSHLDVAYENGYSPFTTRRYIMVADGLKGVGGTLVPTDGEYIKEAKIGRVVVGANIIISLARFRGHEATSSGGTLKNLDMGNGSRADKMEVHSADEPFVHTDKCVGCGACQRSCAHGATTALKRETSTGTNKCVGYDRCIDACPVDAANSVCDGANDILNWKIVEYTLAVLKDCPNFHVSFVVDMPPNCDCHSENNAPIVPSMGMFASFDPVTLDMTCMGAVDRQPMFIRNFLSEQGHHSHGRSVNTHPNTNWETCIDHAVELDLSNREYSLITI